MHSCRIKAVVFGDYKALFPAQINSGANEEAVLQLGVVHVIPTLRALNWATFIYGLSGTITAPQNTSQLLIIHPFTHKRSNTPMRAAAVGVI